MNNLNRNTKTIKINNAIIEIKIGNSKRSLSGKLSARPVQSIFKSKSLKRVIVNTTAKVNNLKSYIS